MAKSKSEQIEELLEKGVANIYPSRKFLEERLDSGQKLKIYQGFDPTGNTLHMGSMVGILKLKQFQELGHEVIFLIGDYTAMIGDPDKKTARQPLTREQVLANCRDYQKQAGKILNFKGKNPVALKFNSQWLSKLTFADTLNLLTNFTVQRMLERDLFEERIKSGNPLYLHEFMYPIMQAYDSVAMDVDGEIGGNDQTFNMLSGRDLMRNLKNKEKFVLTMKLLEDPTGKKMGKTEGNMITLNDSPADMFGKVMSWPDNMITLGFELCTQSTVSEVADIEKMLKSGVNPRDLKAELGKEIVTLYHSKQKALEAEKEFNQIFREKNNPDQMPEIKVKNQSYNIVNLLLMSRLVDSKSEGKRLVEQNGVKLDDKTIVSWKADVAPKNGAVLKVGKRKFAKLVIK
ncbi:tyrosine--tRNA ligase [Candidatus Kuenenbacteria bacterium RIFCSPLOWO2_12_FULL_42_13]|uniref:Tyrosine--tRNA ligase n=2 Tax=Candidatus Kueneniibacteriota TaxID=1752740 RepID=A0A1F6FZY2_9BACT|nr:MAG: tyrosine--tRNA ligase [Candidatus Kuenenbacteria bacterium RIFCSPHIGHO2_02_FULL_42_29]OGG90333.1 MAG: tyrosine--tRNA ligase [Candidatus Kuenenbacteria bacterium RIFCSPLOWO2_02_FULL_42_16]OGG91418.1 MAG: tyrosine--tRNA ligase [Candidatus Kuenenbacteria bacterium RIFCSPLOWO2_12_FULL_42_13]